MTREVKSDVGEGREQKGDGDRLGGGGNVGTSNLSNQLNAVDPRMSGILQNLQNSGNLTIHFHFNGNPQ